jgi:myo-inositol-1(or 4)-monophosphatase
MNTFDLRNCLDEVMAMSREIGNWMKSQRVEEIHAELKTPNNLVTYVDKESERRFVEGLSALLPEAGFVAEEGTGKKNENGLNWVIDPLDGTTNFVHGVPVWCTSIGLALNEKPILGVIYDPNTDEMYAAAEGLGATLNGRRIVVSKIEKLSHALLATGFPYDDFGRVTPYLDLFKRLMTETRGMRRLGSAALDMAWTAAGRFEGFYEYGLNPWDVAAGAIIIREAGGKVEAFHEDGDPVFGEDLICTNGHIQEQLKELVRIYFP